MAVCSSKIANLFPFLLTTQFSIVIAISLLISRLPYLLETKK